MRLSLVTGSPATLRQALYDAYYVQRPEVPVEVAGRVLPRVDGGEAAAPPLRARADASANLGRSLESALAPGALAAPGAFAQNAQMPVPFGVAAPPPPAAAPAPAVEAAAAAEADAHAVYAFPESVRVGNGHSLLVPIVDRDIPAERVSVWHPGDPGNHPMASVLLRNETGATLPPGVVTLYDAADGAAHVGDARLGAVPPGETRIVGYAVDRKVAVEPREESDAALVSATAVDGVLRIASEDRARTVYRVRGASDAARRLILEHPRRAGWEAAGAAAGAPTTATAYRIRLDVPAGGSAETAAELVRPRAEQIRIDDADPARILAIAATGRRLPPRLRDGLDEAGRLATQAQEAERRAAAAAAERQRITAEQERIRANVETVGRQSDLGQRYVRTLLQQEDRLERLAADAAKAAAEAERLRDALRAAVRALRS